MVKWVLTIFGAYLIPFIAGSQIVFEQDIVQGGVTGAGFSTGQGYGAGVFDIYIEPGSTIKKAFLFSYSNQFPQPATIILNDIAIHMSINTNKISQVNFHNPPWINAHPVCLYAVDVTNIIDSNITEHTAEIPNQSSNAGINEAFWTIYLIVVYENENLPYTAYTIVVNNQSLTGFEYYEINNLLPVSNNNPVGFSVYTDRHTFSELDISIVSFNGIELGEIYTADAVNQSFISSGVKGHFYYQNNTFYGLDDDIPNYTMNESDGIADVSGYIDDNATSINFSLQHIRYPNQPPSATNINLAYFLTYTSPCQPFEASLLTTDTTTCPKNPLQLGVTVPDTINATHEWLPQTNLSCYDCPNPIFMGNTTTNYTVRIWASDSCSKVLPVRVRVLPQPNFESIEITESVCGGATGSIAVASSGLSQPHTFQINGGTPQNNGNFNNLAAGEYTVTITNAVGCSKDSVVVVGEFNNVQAAFSVNPTTGAAPLDISITNQSQNATEYQWFWEDQSSTLTNPSVTLDTSGVYSLTLVAGNGTTHCNDTTSIQIFVYDSLQVVVPNVFTPNNDGSNDWFGITTNIPISAKIVVVNRWGNVLVEKSFTTQANIFEPIWDGTSTGSVTAPSSVASEGVYFYRIFDIQSEVGQGLVLDKETEFQGFVHLVR